jgi:hypothetical protein
MGNPHRSRDNFRFVVAVPVTPSEHLRLAQFLTRRTVFLTYCKELAAKRREYDEHEAARGSSRCERSVTKTLETRASSGPAERSTHTPLHTERPFILRAFTSHSTLTPLLETVE